MEQLYIRQAQMNARFDYLDSDTDAEWTDVDVSDRDLAMIEWLLMAIARNDVALVTKIVAALSQFGLSLDTLSFRDTETETDSNQVYSMLGLANSLGAHRVAAYLMSCGLTDDFMDDGGIFH